MNINEARTEQRRLADLLRKYDDNTAEQKEIMAAIEMLNYCANQNLHEGDLIRAITPTDPNKISPSLPTVLKRLSTILRPKVIKLYRAELEARIAGLEAESINIRNQLKERKGGYRGNEKNI